MKYCFFIAVHHIRLFFHTINASKTLILRELVPVRCFLLSGLALTKCYAKAI